MVWGYNDSDHYCRVCGDDILTNDDDDDVDDDDDDDGVGWGGVCQVVLTLTGVKSVS